jgi:phenylalanyl-tRNA synthetase beta chain
LHEKGIEYAHILEGKEVYPIIFDKNDSVLSFPPIINGELTEVTEETKNIFLDLTGTDFEAINLALNILVTTLYDMGAKIEKIDVDYENGKSFVTPDLTPKEFSIETEYINDYLGLNLKQDEIIHCLRKTRLDAKKSSKKGSLNVFVPAFRGDFMHPVDITEECGIGYGYFNIPKTINDDCIGEFHPVQEISNKLRTIMIGAGYLEVLNFILTNSKRQYIFMKQDFEEDDHIQIANPVSKQYNTIRTNILPKLMETIRYNRSEEKPIRIFEVGDVILLDEDEETKTKREVHLSSASYHDDADYTETKSTLDFLMTSLGLKSKYKVEKHKNPTYIEGRCGKIILDGEIIGEIGEIHPEVLINYKLEFPVASFEINIEKLL